MTEGGEGRRERNAGGGSDTVDREHPARKRERDRRGGNERAISA